MSKKGIIPDPWGVPDCRTVPSERGDLEVRYDPPKPSQELRCTVCPYRLNELTNRLNELTNTILSSCLKTMRELAEICSNKGALITYPTPYLMRIEASEKSLEISFTPDDPVSLARLLRKAVEFFGD